MTTTQVILFVGFALCSIVANVFWYRAKFFLRARGFPVSFFTHHWQDLDHLSQLIESETDPVERARVQRLRSGIMGFLVASLALFGVFFASHLVRMYSR